MSADDIVRVTSACENGQNVRAMITSVLRVRANVRSVYVRATIASVSPQRVRIARASMSARSTTSVSPVHASGQSIHVRAMVTGHFELVLLPRRRCPRHAPATQPLWTLRGWTRRSRQFEERMRAFFKPGTLARSLPSDHCSGHSRVLATLIVRTWMLWPCACTGSTDVIIVRTWGCSGIRTHW